MREGTTSAPHPSGAAGAAEAWAAVDAGSDFPVFAVREWTARSTSRNGSG